jgi:hypothetical protein
MPTSDHERIVVLEKLFEEQGKKLDDLQETLNTIQTKLFNGYFDKKIADKMRMTFAEFKTELFNAVEEKIAKEVDKEIKASIGSLVIKVLAAGIGSGAFIQLIIQYFSK